MAFPWSAAIGAGADLLGGILGNTIFKKKKGPGPEAQINLGFKNTMTQLRALVEGAKAAGIHPLAALGANVSGGGFAQPVAGQSSWGDTVASGLSFMGSLYGDDADTMRGAMEDQDAWRSDYMAERAKWLAAQDKGNDLSQELMRAQIQNVQMDTARQATDIMNARNNAIGAVGPSELLFPFSGWSLSGDPQGAQKAQNMGGEIAEWQYSLETYLANLIRKYPWLDAKPGDILDRLTPNKGAGAIEPPPLY